MCAVSSEYFGEVDQKISSHGQLVIQINTSKTKEMIIGSLDSINASPLSTSSGTVERAATFKLLGIYLDINLSRSVHINLKN